MNCSELEALLCDYAEGALSPAQRDEVELHLSGCSACAQMARDAAAAVGFMRSIPHVEPPPGLITRILFEKPASHTEAKERSRGLRAALGRFFGPVLEPRFAMGMAMTVLSFALLGRFAGIHVRQLQLSDLEPVTVYHRLEDQSRRTWARAVTFYESLRYVYELRSRLSELTAQKDETAQPAVPPQGPQDTGSGSPRPGKQPAPEAGARGKVSQ